MSNGFSVASQQSTLVQIGKRHLLVDDVLVRDQRQIQRHELQTWQLREALMAAFEAGRAQATGD